jgi:hypothetical protein
MKPMSFIDDRINCVPRAIKVEDDFKKKLFEENKHSVNTCVTGPPTSESLIYKLVHDER